MSSYPKSDIDYIRLEGQSWRWTGERVLITGATGFIGSWLAEVLDYQCKLTLGRDFVEGEYDTIFHLAPTPIEPVIESAKKTGAMVIYASSGAVYGGVPKQVKETDLIIPKTEYGREKARSERMLMLSGVDYRILRIFALAGPGMRDYFALTAFINAVKAGKPMEVYGTGKTIRSYLYIADMLVWLFKIADFGRPGAYNVGSEIPISILELADRISDYVHGHPVKHVQRYFVEPAPYYLPDCARAHEIGLQQHFGLDYAIKRMLE